MPGATKYGGMRNRNSGLMLDNRDGSLLDGAVIQQWTGNGPGPQRWLLERANQEIATGESTRWR
ncbi:RICIN domain-containing protein [Massilia aquatica]